jgi:hypothetical protein
MTKRAAVCICCGLFVVSFTGSFPEVAGALDLYPASLHFGNSPQTVTLTNRGAPTPLRLGQIRIVGENAGDFSKITTCGSELPAEASCTLSISFRPGATGMRSAALVVGGEGEGGPLTVSLTGAGQFMALGADRTHLINTFTNKPVFITGDTAYALALALSSDADIEAYLSDRQAKGMNLIWVGLVDANNHGDGKDNVGTTENDTFGNNPWNGGPAFTGMSSSTAYWAHVDEVLQRAAAHGITVLAGTAFAGSFASCNDPYTANMVAASDATMLAYGAFLGNRYKSYPNIIWLQGGDANVSLCGSALANKVSDIAKGILSVDTGHLMAVEATSGVWGEPSATNWSAHTYGASNPSGWLTLGTIYPKGTPDRVFSAEISQIVSQCVTESTATPYVPYFSMEDPYEYEPLTGTPYNNQQLRQQGYTEILSGARLGRLFGSSGVWPFGSGCCMRGLTWQTNMGNLASFDQQRLGQLFRSREHWKLVGDLKHTVVTAGYGSGANLSVASRTSDGQTIIAYIPNGNATTLTVAMNKISSGINLAACWWFNPFSGASTLIGNYANSGTRSFTPPDANDWILVIDDAAANLPAPGTP